MKEHDDRIFVSVQTSHSRLLNSVMPLPSPLTPSLGCKSFTEEKRDVYQIILNTRYERILTSVTSIIAFHCGNRYLRTIEFRGWMASKGQNICLSSFFSASFGLDVKGL